MIKIQFKFLFNRFVIISYWIMILIFFVLFMALSRFYIDLSELGFNQVYYFKMYLFESLSFWKLVMMIYLLLIVYFAYILNRYEYFVLPYTTRTKYIVSKLVILHYIVGLVVITSWLVMVLVPYYLTPFVDIGTMINILPKMMLFACYYLNLMHLVVLWRKIYPLLVILFLYLVVFLQSDLEMNASESSVMFKVMSFIFVDINNSTGNQYNFLYGISITFSFMVFFIIGSIKAFFSLDT